MALFGTIWHAFEGALSQKAISSNGLAQIKEFAGTLAPAAGQEGPRNWRSQRLHLAPIAVQSPETRLAGMPSKSKKCAK